MSSENLVIDPVLRTEIEALIIEHAWPVDHNESYRLADLYTENGRLLGVGSDKVGRKALTEYGAERAGMAKRTARHVINNIRLIREGETRISGASIIILFRADGEERAPADPNRGRGLPREI